MIASFWALKAGLKTVNSEDLFPVFCFKYFISQPGIIHWINVWAAPFGKRLAVRTSPLFLLERRQFMLGTAVLAAWLVSRECFLQRDTLWLGAAAAGKPGWKRSCLRWFGLSGDPVAGKCCCWSRARAQQASRGDVVGATSLSSCRARLRCP